MFTISKGIGGILWKWEGVSNGKGSSNGLKFYNGCDHQHKPYDWNHVSSFVTRLMCNYHFIECDEHTNFNHEITKLKN
jgi:hypothetical protein